MSKEYQKHLESIKKWNDRRARIEESGVKKFWSLKAMFDAEKKKANSCVGSESR